MGIEGIWNLKISTPVGEENAVYKFSYSGEKLTGFEIEDKAEKELDDLTLENGKLKWIQKISKPIKMSLMFDIQIEGDTLSGTVKAGKFPKTRVTGHRIHP